MDIEKYKKTTGKIYGNLFSGYSKEQFDNSVELFLRRHKRWNFDINWFNGKECLDAGCGGGRYLVALSKLNAKKVVGVDISSGAVSVANSRLRERKHYQAQAIEGSVLELPFPDNSFDYVVCSGVIHHTPDPIKGFNELVRVLRPKGKLFLSVYGKGGLRWLFGTDIYRYTVCKLIPFHVLENIWKFFGVSANKRYAQLDNMYVPYCFRYKEREIREWLQNTGFNNIQRVKFERYDYEKPLSRIVYGEGWIQMYADKK